jgi:hypothetical protein
MNYVLLLIIFTFTSGTNDLNIFASWIDNVNLYGLLNGFAENKMDYPPLSSVLLKVSELIFQILSLDNTQNIKLLGVAFLLICFFVFYKITENFIAALTLMVFLTLSSTSLGYIDIYFLPTFLLSLFFLQKNKFHMFSFFFTLTILIKWQPIIIAPFFLVYIIRKIFNEPNSRKKRRIIFDSTSPALVILFGALSLWGFVPIAKSFIYASFFHDFLSANALNFNWVLTWLIRVIKPELFGGLTSNKILYIADPHGKLTILFIGLRVIFAIFYLYALYKFTKSEIVFENLLKFSALGYLSYFTFNIGVHENHLFLIIPILAYLSYLRSSFTLQYILAGFAFNLNLFLFYGISGDTSEVDRVFAYIDLSLFVAFTSVVYFFLFYFQEICFNKSKLDIRH